VLTSLLPALAQQSSHPYAVYVNGESANAVSGFFDGAHVMLSLEGIAADLGYRITRTGTTRLLHVRDDIYSFAPGSADVLLDGESILQARALPVERRRLLYVCVCDLKTILSQTLVVTKNRIDISAAQAPQNLHTSPLTHPRVSSYTMAADSEAPAAPRAFALSKRFNSDPANALIVHAEVSDFGGFHSRSLSFTTDGTRVRGDIGISKFGDFSAFAAGQLAVGSRTRYVQMGDEGNPLSGLVFNAPGGTGLNVQRANTAYGWVHDSLGRTVVLMRRDDDYGATMYGLVRIGGTAVPIIGRRASTDGILKTTREIWLTGSGLAGSMSVASQGRIFGEAVASASIGKVPLTVGEAPQRLNLGFRASNRLTFRAGITSGYRLPGTPYFAATVNGTRGISGSVQLAGNAANAELSYASLQSSVSAVYTTSNDNPASWAISGTLEHSRRIWDFSAYHSGANQDDVIRTHMATGPGFILGAEHVRQSGRTRIGPIFGISLPVGRLSSFELSEHPISTGRTLALGFMQRIEFAPHISMRSLAITNSGISVYTSMTV